ncbi:MAG TPA: acyloxyacyl hydrolase [Paludibacteraceae bacterium]|nr:acyloxyacyl hydrolase [Paludibacteraceae bacterium]
MMKKTIFFALLFICFGQWSMAQKIPFIIKASVYGGYIVPMTKNLDSIAHPPALGGELAIEFPSMGNYDWQHHWRMPTVGVGLLGINLGNPKLLGTAFAVYPYLLVPVVKTKHFHLNYKIGAGLSFFTKTWNDGDTLSGVNASTANSAIGSILNVYLTTGANFEFPISKQFSITSDIGYNHMSNGSMLQPNAGINMLQAMIGAKYLFPGCAHCNKPKPPIDGFPYDFSINLIASGGARELYYKDNKMYPIGSFHASMSANLTNWYALGGGFDVFYDGVFVQQGTRGAESYRNNTLFGRYFIPTEDLANKFRAGVCLSNEFIIGRVTAVLQWGVYVYDPIRNATHDPHPVYGDNRPMFYSYDIEKEDGWNYFRLGVRCRVYDNLFVNASLKTHLQKAEMIEWGIGYQIPYTKKQESDGRRGSYAVYHPDRKWKRGDPNKQWQPVGVESEDPPFNLGR